MKRTLKIIFLLSFILIVPFFIQSRGSSFGGSFLGGFSGSLIGNVISQPRQPRQCVTQQPVQTRVVEVHKPVYVEVQGGKSKPKKRYQRSYGENEIIEQREMRDIRERADQRTLALQQETAQKTATDQIDQKMKELVLKEKEIELKKAEADLAKAHAENEKLRLELQQLQVPK